MIGFRSWWRRRAMRSALRDHGFYPLPYKVVTRWAWQEEWTEAHRKFGRRRVVLTCLGGGLVEAEVAVSATGTTLLLCSAPTLRKALAREWS